MKPLAYPIVLLAILLFPSNRALGQGESASLFCRVIDKQTQEPLSGIDLNLFNEEGVLVGKGKTNEKGELTFSELSRGAFLLKADLLGYRRTWLRGIALENGDSLMIKVLMFEDHDSNSEVYFKYSPSIRQDLEIDLNFSVVLNGETVRTYEEISHCSVSYHYSYPPDDSTYGISQEFMMGSASRTIFTFP